LTDYPVLREIGIFLVAAAAFVLLARSVRMPAIVAYLLAGLALGPGLGLVGVSETVNFIAHVGIALLLFLVGLELSLERIRDVGRVAMLAGIGQVIVTTLVGTAVCLLLGFDFRAALFLAFALTFSSTVVVVKLLDQKRELNHLYGRIAVGIFLVQDVVVILVLTFLAGMRSPEQLDARGLALGLVRAFGGMALLVAAAVGAARWLLPSVFAWLAESLDAMFIASLCWCFLFVAVAELLQLSPEIGAFIAGISLAQLPYHHELHRRVRPLMNVAIAIFFVSLGVTMNVEAARPVLLSALVLVVFVLAISPVIIMWIVTRLGYGERTAFLSSVTVAQVSEFSFILVAVAREAGIVEAQVAALTGVVGLTTIAASAYMILHNHRLYEWVRRTGVLRILRAPAEQESEDAELRRNHVVVVGVNALGRRIVHGLVRKNVQVLAVDTNASKLASLPCDVLLGNIDSMAVVEQAGIPHARLIVSALQIEDTNRLLAFRCRDLGVPVAIHAFDQAVVPDLEQMGVDHLILSKSDGLRVLTLEMDRAGVLG
jgi:Kef-type K+ transport system membrane component KefB